MQEGATKLLEPVVQILRTDIECILVAVFGAGPCVGSQTECGIGFDTAVDADDRFCQNTVKELLVQQVVKMAQKFRCLGICADYFHKSLLCVLDTQLPLYSWGTAWCNFLCASIYVKRGEPFPALLLGFYLKSLRACSANFKNTILDSRNHIQAVFLT